GHATRSQTPSRADRGRSARHADDARDPAPQRGLHRAPGRTGCRGRGRGGIVPPRRRAARHRDAGSQRARGRDGAQPAPWRALSSPDRGHGAQDRCRAPPDREERLSPLRAEALRLRRAPSTGAFDRAQNRSARLKRAAPHRRLNVVHGSAGAIDSAGLFAWHGPCNPLRWKSQPRGDHMKRRSFFKTLALAASIAAISSSSVFAQQKTVKVGILHSLSGTMAISETVLKDTVLMAIDEINAKGGVMGAKIEPVVVDPASNWPLFAEKARQLLTQDKVAVVFGCWTSVSRKSVLPVFEELNGLLFYPVQYEGEEISKNVFYTGAAPNQQAIPAVEYLMSKEGGGAKRWVLLGTDYVYPRTTNKILRAFLKSKNIPESDIIEDYTPFGHTDYQTIIAKIKKFSSEGKKTAVISTINGDSNVPFYKELGNQ